MCLCLSGLLRGGAYLVSLCVVCGMHGVEGGEVSIN